MRGYTTPISSLTLEDFFPLVDLALTEDLPQGDITTDSIFSKVERATAKIRSREKGILCGSMAVEALLFRTNSDLVWTPLLKDGDPLEEGSIIGEFTGSLADLLRIERILLNFLQYLSAIATNTHLVVKKYPNLLILDTRKTLPGYRKLAKYAVYTGGGANHRLNLSEMAMLKDNHVSRAGSIKSAIAKIRELHPKAKVELEIDEVSQLEEAVKAEPDIILLDNFSHEDVQVAINYLRKNAPQISIECSGGITPEKLEFLSQFKNIGVSMGYLTHTVRFLDLGLDI